MSPPLTAKSNGGELTTVLSDDRQPSAPSRARLNDTKLPPTSLTHSPDQYMAGGKAADLPEPLLPGASEEEDLISSPIEHLQGLLATLLEAAGESAWLHAGGKGALPPLAKGSVGHHIDPVEGAATTRDSPSPSIAAGGAPSASRKGGPGSETPARAEAVATVHARSAVRSSRERWPRARVG
jgi:hypothetical protein